MAIFAKIFNDLGIEVKIFFDEDDNQQIHNQTTNQLLSSFTSYKFCPNIETEIGYTGHKLNTVAYMQFLSGYTVPNLMNI